MDQKLKYALILAFAVNSLLVVSNFYNRTFDSYTHIFFADHYRRSWFNTWEPKWFGGFSVTSYPPLAHQAIALVSYVFGLVGALQVLTFVLTLIFPIAIYKFSEIFVSEEAAGYASIISVFFPSVLTVTYNFGQLPTLMSLVATLFMVYYLSKYLKKGAKLDFALSCCLLAVSVSTHHFTTLFFTPLVVVVLLIMLVQGGVHFRTLAKRLSIFFVVGLAFSLIVIYPFLLYSIGINMQPIAHITRTNLLSDPYAFKWFVLSMYGTSFILIPFAGLLVYHNRRLIPLFIVAILLLILGLGGTTPLPGLLFGHLWLILTYERFSLWAGVAFLPLLGLFFSLQLKKGLKPKKYRREILGIFLVSLFISGMYFGTNSVFQPTNVDLAPFRDFLATDGNARWRYITLGFGDAQMQELSVMTNASTLDGYYYLGRTIPILVNSSIASLDSSKYYGEHGKEVLASVLRNASDYSLRWVFCNDPYYYSVLNESGFVLAFLQDSTGDGRLHGVTIWDKGGIPPIANGSSNDTETHQTSLSDYVWGIAPMSFLFATIILSVLAFISRKRSFQTNTVIKNDGAAKLINDDEQLIKKIWDTAYLETNDKERKIIWSRLDYLLFKKVQRHLDSKSLVLEAGCGVSGIMGFLISEKIQVIGVDISAVALTRAHKLLGKPFLIQADIHQLPLRDYSFNLVYNVGVMEHFVNPEKPLRELVRVLKPSGTVVIAVPNKLNLWSLGKMSIDLLSRLHVSNPWKYGYEKSYTKNGVKNLLSSIGLKETNVSGCGVFEGFYITAYFSLQKSKVLLQYLKQYLFNETDSIFGTVLKHFAEAMEKIDIFGLHVVASARKNKLAKKR